MATPRKANPKRVGQGAGRIAREFVRPASMTVEQLESEARALMRHNDQIVGRGTCLRLRCDGQPHEGFRFEHDAKLNAEPSPLAEAQFLDPSYRSRSHLTYLSDRLTDAVADVETGVNRYVTISMPPRMGKSQLTSVYLPLWLLHKHPSWKIGLISHSPSLATGWGRQVRRLIEENSDELNLHLAHDAGAVSEWQTTHGGGIVSRSAPGQSPTGMGFKVMLIDDPVKDFASAHSATERQKLWDWWINNSVTRLEAPYLVIVIGTRWHEDDLIGRLLSREYEGNPKDWEVVSFPAVAEQDDVLGRKPGEPLISPIIDETPDQATARWKHTHTMVGTYGWTGLYQQRPAPAQGAIFNTEWWRFWTPDPTKATDDGKVKHIDPSSLHGGRFVDSWDCTFKGGKATDYVVGQRWVKYKQDRYLIAQKRDHLSFTETISAMQTWALTDRPAASPAGHLVFERLIEDAANGPAIIDTLKDAVSGLVPIQAKESKESRARAITPEVEAGNVYLPHPTDPGNEWVADLLSELRNFPNDVHDDQVDALTQFLRYVRTGSGGSVTVPRLDGQSKLTPTSVSLDRAASSKTSRRYGHVGNTSHTIDRGPR